MFIAQLRTKINATGYLVLGWIKSRNSKLDTTPYCLKILRIFARFQPHKQTYSNNVRKQSEVSEVKANFLGRLMVAFMDSKSKTKQVPSNTYIPVFKSRVDSKCMLPDGESNPGLPRDRRGYLPLYYRGDDNRAGTCVKSHTFSSLNDRKHEHTVYTGLWLYNASI